MSIILITVINNAILGTKSTNQHGWKLNYTSQATYFRIFCYDYVSCCIILHRNWHFVCNLQLYFKLIRSPHIRDSWLSLAMLWNILCASTNGNAINIRFRLLFWIINTNEIHTFAIIIIIISNLRWDHFQFYCKI